jgi:hypothetical protein
VALLTKAQIALGSHQFVFQKYLADRTGFVGVRLNNSTAMSELDARLPTIGTNATRITEPSTVVSVNES